MRRGDEAKRCWPSRLSDEETSRRWMIYMVIWQRAVLDLECNGHVSEPVSSSLARVHARPRPAERVSRRSSCSAW